MIVCLCKGIGSREIARHISDGAGSVEAIGAACGAGTDCGGCRDHIEDMLEESAPRPSRRSLFVHARSAAG